MRVCDTQSILGEPCVPGFVVYPAVLYKTDDAEREGEREGQAPSPHKPPVFAGVGRAHTAGRGPAGQDSLQMHVSPVKSGHL